MKPLGRTETERTYIDLCERNPSSFYAGELWIENVKRDLVPFGHLYPAPAELQRRKDECDREGRPFRSIILKARRHRISATVEAMLCHALRFRENLRAYVVAQDDETPAIFKGMLDTYIDNLSPLMQMTRIRDSKRAVKVAETNGRVFYRTAGTSRQKAGAGQGGRGVGRGDRIDFLHGSEVGEWPNGGEAFIAMSQSLSEVAGSTVILEGTAQGMGGFFYDSYMKHRDDPNSDWDVFFFPWYIHPEYSVEYLAQASNRPSLMPAAADLDIFAQFQEALVSGDTGLADRYAAVLKMDEEEVTLVRDHPIDWSQVLWRRWWIPNKCNGVVEKFRQEFPATDVEAFLTSGRSRFDNRRIYIWIRQAETYTPVELTPKTEGWGWLRQGGINPKMHHKVAKGIDQLLIKQLPQIGRRYVIGGDAAEGIGGDDSAMVVTDAETFEPVAYRHDAYADPVQLARWEIEAGWWYGQALVAQEVNAPGNLTVHKLVEAGYPNIYYRARYDKATGPPREPGFRTDRQTKELILGHLDTYIRLHPEADPLLICKAILQQLSTMAHDPDTKKTNALAGHKDDLVLTYAIACWVAYHERDSLSEVDIPEEFKKHGWHRGPPRTPGIEDEADLMRELGLPTSQADFWL